MHEAVLEHCLGNPRRPVGKAHQRHELRLQVGRESGERVGGDVCRPDAAICGDPDAVIILVDGDSAPAQHLEQRIKMPRAGILQCQLAAGDRGGNGECAGLDPVGDDVVSRIGKAVDTLDRNCIHAVAGDARAHCDQAFGKIADLGLARGIHNFGCALGECGRDHRVFGGADRHHRKDDARAGQPAGRPCLNVAVGELDDRAKGLHRTDMEINRPGADGAAARKRHARLTVTRQQRPEHKDRGAHLADKVIGSVEIGGAAPDHQHVARSPDIHAMIAKKDLHRSCIDKVRNVSKPQCAVGDESCRNQGQRRVFRPADHDLALQRHAAFNPQTVHIVPP